MRKKNTFLAGLFTLILSMLAANTFAQVYSHDFSTSASGTNPYTASPSVLHPDLSNSLWSTNNANGFTDFTVNGTSLAISIPAGFTSSPTYTLAFTVATGKQLQIDSFNFWRRRSPSGPQTWTMTINGIAAGNGTVPTTAAAIGVTNVANPITGLTGTVTIVITLPSAPGGSFRLDDFVLNGNVTTSCTAPLITSLSPSSGSAGTIVTINGSGFNAGTTSVKFNGIDAVFTVISDNIITATVPAGATTGNISLTTNSCPGTGPAFTVLATNCTTFASGTELYISEVYDEQLGSGGVVEIYNPTNSTVTFNGNYVIQRYGNINDTTPTAGYIIPLTGSIAPGMTYLIAGTNPANCTITAPVSFPAGFNENDKLELLKNGVVIDVVNVPFSAPGYTLIRKPDAVAPSAVYNINDWNNSATEDCSTIGSHTALPTVPAPVIATQPQSQSVCENGTDTFTVAVDNAAGFTYQWKILNAAGVWVNVTDNANYAGATTNTLTLSQTPAGFNGNQYYVQISSGSCTLISNAVNLTVLPLPAVADVTPTQPTCTVATGTIVANSPTGAGFTYSINGGAFQSSTTFANLAPGPYTVKVQNTDGCTSVTPTITINAVPNAPAVADVTLTQPTCTTPTGTIVVNSPTGAGLTYSINGGAFQSSTTFANLAPGPYTVTVQNTDGCTSITPTITINAVPNAPAVADVTLTQPTCTTPTGTIVVNSPTGAGLTYSINGGAFQSSTTFANLAPGPYTVTVQNTDGCSSVTPTITINAVPNAPAVADVTPTQPTCTVATGTIVVNSPTGAGLTYSINGGAFQSSTTFANLAPGPYTVTVQNTDGCTSVTPTITINAVPNAPAVADVTLTQPTCTTPTGTIVVNSPTGAGLTYSINGGAFQSSTTFANLAPGPYTVTVQNTDGCISVTPTITINAVPNAPAVADVTPTQPTCTTPTGTIVVNSPTGAGLTYSLNGGAFQNSTTFANLAPGPYTVTVQNTDGCTSVTPTITINAVPNAPAVADVTPTQPTCTTPTGTIVVNSPTGAGLTYSLNGGAFQNSTTFANLAPGPYTVTVQNTDGCTSVTAPITINATATPIQITTVQGCEDTMSGKKFILQAFPLNGSFDINTADFEWRYNGMVVGTNENIFNVTDYVSLNNIDLSQFPLEFTVTVTSGGCIETVSFIVESTFCTIPKGVSPNNDTLNDNFNLIGLNVNKLSIFNRYGKEVYSKNNYRNEWHGQSDSDGELPTGTYYYVIERTTGSTESGWVYLNREN